MNQALINAAHHASGRLQELEARVAKLEKLVHMLEKTVRATATKLHRHHLWVVSGPFASPEARDISADCSVPSRYFLPSNRVWLELPPKVYRPRSIWRRFLDLFRRRDKCKRVD